MAGKSYIGISNYARKIKKAYIGIGGYARRVKKIYIGISNVARCIFSACEVVYHGASTALVTPRFGLAATQVGSYALFGGGYNAGTFYNKVDAYNTSLTRSTPTQLSRARDHIAAASTYYYAMFGGGRDDSYVWAAVEAYNHSLTMTLVADLSVARSNSAAATLENSLAMFGGGVATNLANCNIVDMYNSYSLTKMTSDSLSVARSDLAAASLNQEYVLFGGGMYRDNNMNHVATDVVDVYDRSRTRSTAESLPTARRDLVATSLSSYVLFGGGVNSNSAPIDNVDVYTKQT